MSFSEWKEFRLDDLVESVSVKHSFENDKIILVNTSDVLDGKVLNHEYVENKNLKGQFKKSFKQGDILYSEIRPKNKRFAYVDFDAEEYVASTKLMVLRKKNNEVDNNFLFQILKSDEFILILQNLAETRSGTFPQITFTELGMQKVRIPQIEEQEAIAHILSTLDDKIEVNNQINKTLENMAQAIFKQWFVDFEFPNEDGEPYKSSGGEMVESELGMIPKGWEVTKLTSISEAVSGYSYKGKELIPSEDAMITIKNFNVNGSFKLEGFKEIEISDRVKEKHYANLFDIIVAHTDLTQNADIIGNPVIILNKINYKNVLFSMDTVKVVPFKEEARFYLFELLKDSNFKGYALAHTSGTTVLHLSKKTLPNYTFVCPKDYLMKDYNNLVRPIFMKLKELYSENTVLERIKDTLLPKLMSGEIRVPIDTNSDVS